MLFSRFSIVHAVQFSRDPVRILVLMNLVQDDPETHHLKLVGGSSMKRLGILLLLGLLVVACQQPQHAPKTVIATEMAPEAIGPYSQAVQIGNTLYCSGQLGMVPDTGEFAEGGIQAQARQALENQSSVLKAAGYSLSDVVQCQVFITDMDNYGAFNEVYSDFFNAPFPARAVVQVSRLPKDGLVEIMMIAAR